MYFLILTLLEAQLSSGRVRPAVARCTHFRPNRLPQTGCLFALWLPFQVLLLYTYICLSVSLSLSLSLALSGVQCFGRILTLNLTPFR